MTYRVACRDLEIVGCNAVFEGDTPEDVLNQARPHLAEHNIHLPANDLVLNTSTNILKKFFASLIYPGMNDEGTQLIITRLREQLGIRVPE